MKRVERSVRRENSLGQITTEIWAGRVRCGYRIDPVTHDFLTIVPRSVGINFTWEEERAEAIRLYAKMRGYK